MNAAAHGTRVNAVAPGVIITNIHGEGVSQAELDAAAVNVQLLPRAGAPAEVSQLICFLLSDEASFCTGSTYDVDAGYHIKA